MTALPVELPPVNGGRDRSRQWIDRRGRVQGRARVIWLRPSPHIYAVAGAEGPVKVGLTMYPAKRLREIIKDEAMADPLRLAVAVPVPAPTFAELKAIEARVHALLAGWQAGPGRKVRQELFNAPARCAYAALLAVARPGPDARDAVGQRPPTAGHDR